MGSLTSLAYEKGLLAEDLDALVDLVTTPSHLDQASIAAVVRNLYPVSNVSSDSTLKVVGSLGHGQLKPSLNVQSLLLRWLIMVYHILGSQSTLSQTYSVLFNLLDTAALRFVTYQNLCPNHFSFAHLPQATAVPPPSFDHSKKTCPAL